MQNRGFVPGKLKLKKTKTSASKQSKREKDAKQKAIPEPDREMVEETGEVELTEAEAKFLSIRNRFKKRVIEKKASISYQEEKEHFNEQLKSYPMHDDLEGK